MFIYNIYILITIVCITVEESNINPNSRITEANGNQWSKYLHNSGLPTNINYNNIDLDVANDRNEGFTAKSKRKIQSLLNKFKEITKSKHDVRYEILNGEDIFSSVNVADDDGHLSRDSNVRVDTSRKADDAVQINQELEPNPPYNPLPMIHNSRQKFLFDNLNNLNGKPELQTTQRIRYVRETSENNTEKPPEVKAGDISAKLLMELKMMGERLKNNEEPVAQTQNALVQGIQSEKQSADNPEIPTALAGNEVKQQKTRAEVSVSTSSPTVDAHTLKYDRGVISITVGVCDLSTLEPSKPEKLEEEKPSLAYDDVT